MQMTHTQNGALANATTGNPVLDFFSRAGGMRGQDITAVYDFAKAYGYNPELARKLLFWLRDVRGGQGERSLFRSCLRYLCDNHPTDVIVNAHLIPEYGRWDDVLVLLDYDATFPTAVEMIRKQLFADLESKDGNVSLCAKWLPSQNASSKKTRTLAYQLQMALNVTPRTYRKILTMLRKDIGILETRLTQKNYTGLRYDRVSSQAMKKHGRKGKAFLTHDPVNFTDYLSAVKTGTKTIKAGTLYPYELVKHYTDNAHLMHYRYGEPDATIEAQWAALPDMPGHNGIVVCDVSGSMNTGAKIAPIHVALSLAIYMAERNDGRFHNHFITFSERPEVQKLVGNTLLEKVQNLNRANWSVSTNIQAVFDALLRWPGDVKDMPDAVYIVSDMEFNVATRNNNQTNFETIRQKFERAGVKMPLLVFWNVNAKSGQVPATQHANGTILLSGASPNTIRTLLTGGIEAVLDLTPLSGMLEVLNGKRYAAVK